MQTIENGTIINGMMILGKTEAGLLIVQDERGELLIINPETLTKAA